MIRPEGDHVIYTRGGVVRPASDPAGDHLIYARTGVRRPVVIAKYSSVPVFIIKNNLRTAGISRERYFELLTK